MRFKNERSNRDFTKVVKAGLDSPRRELSNGGLGIVVALSVFPAIKCVCVGGCGWVGVWVGVYWVSNPAVLAEIFNSLWLTCCYISAVRRESII